MSRGKRKASQFHQALAALHNLAKSKISEALTSAGSKERVQLFCVIMLDADVETRPGSGEYSSNLESEAEWISAAT